MDVVDNFTFGTTTPSGDVNKSDMDVLAIVFLESKYFKKLDFNDNYVGSISGPFSVLYINFSWFSRKNHQK